MKNRQLGFVDRKNGGLYLTSGKRRLTNNLLDINLVSKDILNAFTFLVDKGFVQTLERTTSEAKIYVGIQLSSVGIDVVEGIEYGSDGSANVESVIKDNLSVLLEN